MNLVCIASSLLLLFIVVACAIYCTMGNQKQDVKKKNKKSKTMVTHAEPTMTAFAEVPDDALFVNHDDVNQVSYTDATRGSFAAAQPVNWGTLNTRITPLTRGM